LIPRLAGEESRDIEARLQAIFRAVPLSCMKPTELPTPAPAPASDSAPLVPGEDSALVAASAAAARGSRIARTCKKRRHR
jgi:hypothetical protein